MAEQILLKFDEVESHALQSLSRHDLQEIKEIAEEAVRKELERRGLIKVMMFEGRQRKFIEFND